MAQRSLSRLIEPGRDGDVGDDLARSGALWVGTRGAGLMRVHGDKDGVTPERIEHLTVSMKLPADTEVASRVAVITSCNVTPLARRRSGSISTRTCRLRCPQIATVATPPTRLRSGHRP